MAQAEQEMSLDDFQLDAPKPVGVVTPEQVKAKVGLKKEDGTVQTMTKIEDKIIANLDNQVDTLMNELLAAQLHSPQMKDITNVLNSMGDKEVSETSNMSSRMLQRPIRAMRQNDAGDGSSVASALKNLRMKVTELDPSNRDKLFSKNKFLGLSLPFGIGNKVDSYMQEFKSSEQQLNDIVKALYNGKDSLILDNAEIDVERENMHNLMSRLEQYAYIMKKLDARIEEKLPAIEAEDRMKASDIRQEILFPLRQKSMDIYQHLAVCMQGYMALQVVQKNNVELIRGVERSTKTTMAALRTAVFVSEALGTQKLVLDQIEAVNETTNKLIESNANLLNTQGVAIQKQATEASVDAQTLEKAFQQIFKAMDAMDTFREQALPNMAKTISSLESSVKNAKDYLSSHRQERLGNFAEEVMVEPTAEDKKIVSVRP